MNRKINLILLVLVLAAACCLMLLKNSSEGTKTEETTAAEHKLVSLSSSEVVKLSISPADGKPIVLEKQGADWQILEPVKGKAERFAVDDLVSAITELRSRGQVDARKADAGLGQPRYRLELSSRDGKTTKLAIGARSVLGDTMYVQLGDTAKADVVPAELYKRLGEPVSKLRDPRLLDVSSSDIRQLRIDGPSGRIAMEKDGESWRMTEPQQMPVESADVTDITAQLSSLRAAEFVNEDGSGAARFQLDPPQLSVWFSTAAATTQPAASQPAGLTLKLGRYDGPEKQNLYATVSAFPGVVKVPATLLATLKKKPFELRDRKVAEIVPEAVNSIVISADIPAATQPTTRPANKSAYRVKRNPAAGIAGPPAPATQAATAASTREAAPAWIFEDGTGADEQKVRDLLESVRTVRATRYLESMPASAVSGTYVLTLTTISTGGTSSQTELRILDRGEGQDAIGQCGGLIFELDRSLLSKLNLK